MATTSKKLAIAAFAGLVSAGIMTAGIAHAADGDKMEKSSTASVQEKHACKGQNSCKGKGADGKNECKGKGSCRTDGKAPDAQ
jgi:hypothetical protein